jgi:hypothetical protein
MGLQAHAPLVRLFVGLFLLRFGMTMPGVARRLVTFFASPKKVTQKRRPRRHCPFGIPMKAARRSGSETNSLRSDMFRFFIRPTHCFHGSVSSGTSKDKNTLMLPPHSVDPGVLVLVLVFAVDVKPLAKRRKSMEPSG